MRVLILDPFHGAAGDMITAALLDCGADRNIVVRAMKAVVAEPKISRVTRAGIQALRIETKALPVHRTLSEVLERLDTAAPHVPALAMARRVFERINAAEEEVHGGHVHFHEIGADDAIADIVGACTALHTLGIDRVHILPVTLGHGTGTGSHGTFPIPAPATAAILRHANLSTISGVHAGELCTPTGAALLAEFQAAAGAPGELPAYTIKALGYGAGTRDPAHAPNVLRAMVVETTGTNSGNPEDTVDILETNVDDVSGEVIAHAIARFMDAGARDASAIPIVMKKGRPGYLIRVICLPETSTKIAELMAMELGTLGIRCIPSVHRFIAERTVEEIEVEIAGTTKKCPVKLGWMHGSVYMLKAEFEPARIFSSEVGIPVREVLRIIEETAWKQVRK
ncbi:nickel pincer cofactor biosynthesis protein LarC [Methanoregula formicica]|uniref:Putative nickel insertion protein n=1 Tax=Methanoregula formicica (strain DSM 22288 / NBRC 105244 / SMSP) TaxID=593750 RepID=L0HBC0_METFS|nr:nickel pincer cofactor biosynthesis protein LarC [Methanoregula formicica]AGB01305.1 TIGR00299 family protein [Methanoregula formicica SMSP]